ncbi:MAG: TatD family hydrolase [Prolixibacteraceae bacterium]
MFIDIHTHHAQAFNSQQFSITNIILPQQSLPENVNCCIGWHPWYIEHFSASTIEQNLNQLGLLPQVLAIGECGIDRAIKTRIDWQQNVFDLHLVVAKNLNKPLIVHCVRGYSDVLYSLKRMNFQLPVIFHDYRGNIEQSRELLKFNSYFSFGKSIISELKVKSIVSEIPLSRIFFETDESSLSIEKIYLSAATVLKCSVEELSKQVLNNFKTIFGDELVK